MKKNIIKLSIICTLALVVATAINFKLTDKDNEMSLYVNNIEALASGETSTENCEMRTMQKTNDIIVIENAKNKWLGLVAGCKKKCDHTCTVKNTPDINIEF